MTLHDFSTHEIPLKVAQAVAMSGNRIVMTAPSPAATYTIDVSQQPPSVGPVVGTFIREADVSSGGRVFACIDSSLAEVDPVSGEHHALALPEGRYVGGLRAIGERILVAPPLRSGASGETPAWYDPESGTLTSLELPEPEGGWKLRRYDHHFGFGSYPGWSTGVFDAFDVGSRGALIVWGGWLFHLDGRGVTRLPVSGLRLSQEGFSQGIVDDTGVTCVDRGSLVHLGIDGIREELVPSITNIAEVREGPGALILKQRRERDVLKILWRDSGEVTRITSAQLGSKTPPASVVFLPGRDELASFCFTESHDTVLRLIPWADIVAMPRSSADAL